MIETGLAAIEEWLRTNAEKIAALSLQKPAIERELQELEKAISKELPQDFKQLYRWHNGLTDDENPGNLFFGMDFFPIDRIISEHCERTEQTQKFALEKADPEIDATNIFNPGWVKFGFDGSHTGLYLDLSPTETGQYGQIIFIDEELETGILVANSTTDLVNNFAKDLENGLYSLNPSALEDGHHYLEADKSIDIINWFASERWHR
jgi:cell wall assembly regulator SMI1